MPQRSLTKEERAEAVRKFWETYPFRGSAREKVEAMRKAARELELSKLEIGAVVERLPLDQPWKLLNPDFDMGKEQALKLCKQPLDDSHYDHDMLLDCSGSITAPSEHYENEKDGYVWPSVRGYGPVVCVLLKKVLPQSLLDAVRPLLPLGMLATRPGTGMVKRKKRNGQLSNIMGAPNLEDLSDDDFNRLRSATDGVVGFLSRDIRPGASGRLLACDEQTGS